MKFVYYSKKHYKSQYSKGQLVPKLRRSCDMRGKLGRVAHFDVVRQVGVVLPMGLRWAAEPRKARSV